MKAIDLFAGIGGWNLALAALGIEVVLAANHSAESLVIYVDPIRHYPQCRLPYKDWCHMATDGPLSELYQVAAKLGLRRSWFQDKPTYPHYDLTPGKHARALRFGARAVSTHELVRRGSPQTLGKGFFSQETQEGDTSMQNTPSTDRLVKQLAGK